MSKKPEIMNFEVEMQRLFKGFGFNWKRQGMFGFIANATSEQKDKMLEKLHSIAVGALEQEELWKIHAEKLYRDSPRDNY